MKKDFFRLGSNDLLDYYFSYCKDELRGFTPI